MWLYPYLTWATAALIVFVLGYMLTDTEGESSGRTTVLLSLAVAAVVVVIAFVKEGRIKNMAKAKADADTDAVQAEVK